jgi:hypothetical protein
VVVEVASASSYNFGALHKPANTVLAALFAFNLLLPNANYFQAY